MAGGRLRGADGAAAVGLPLGGRGVRVGPLAGRRGAAGDGGLSVLPVVAGAPRAAALPAGADAVRRRRPPRPTAAGGPADAAADAAADPGAVVRDGEIVNLHLGFLFLFLLFFFVFSGLSFVD